MFRFHGSDDDEPFHADYQDDDDFDFAPGLHRRRRNRYEGRLDYFYKIQQSVTVEENRATLQDEDKLFEKIHCYLKKPFTTLGIFTLQKLAFFPQTVSAERLKGIATIICKNVFNPLSVTDDYLTEYVDFCKAFAFLKGFSNQQGVLISFEQILISEFLDELLKKFNYSQRLKRLLDNRDIPQEKKQKWLEKQIEEQQRVFKMITQKSVNFLDQLFQLYPEIVYRVIELLLNLDDEDGFQYLCTLLEKVRYRHKIWSNEEYILTNIYDMKLRAWQRNEQLAVPRPLARPAPVQKEPLTPLLARIINRSNQNFRLSQRLRNVIQDEIIDGNPLKENVPQDFIKYSIKDCLQYLEYTPEDDFKIDDEDEYDCDIFTLRSKEFIDHGKMHFWRGIRVKILTKNRPNRNRRGNRGR